MTLNKISFDETTNAIHFARPSPGLRGGELCSFTAGILELHVLLPWPECSISGELCLH